MQFFLCVCAIRAAKSDGLRGRTYLPFPIIVGVNPSHNQNYLISSELLPTGIKFDKPNVHFIVSRLSCAVFRLRRLSLLIIVVHQF